MRKITVLLVVVASLGLIQVAFPNASNRLIGLLTGLREARASNLAPLLPKIADKDKPGFPHVNYDDPTVAVREDGSNPAASVATLATTSDFDTDGVPDLVTTGVDGRLLFYKGNPDTIYPNSPEAKQRRAEFGEATPFFAAFPVAEMDFAPDFLESGDFNADGFADLLIAAKGSSQLTVLRGNGGGNFATQQAVRIDGSIMALAVGEIGRKDQQTDVAVSYQSKKGAFTAIFEHPEGAFARKAEIFALPVASQSIAIGNLDTDPYGDVAAAGGSSLTLIHGRGQAYPLDMKADLDIQRPAAFVQSRQMPFAIADVAIGRFGTERGESVALLSTDGRITVLEPQRNEVVINTNKLKADEMRHTDVPSMRPVAAESRNLGLIKNDLPKTEAEADERGQIMADATAIKEDREKVFSDKFAALSQEFAKKTPNEQAAIISAKVQKTVETTARRKVAFEATLAPKPIPFSKFRVETIAADAAIANATSSGRPHQFIKGRFSDSGLDDIAMLDKITGRMNVVGRWNVEGQPSRQASVVSFGVAQSAVSVVPMRLNADALSDLVLIGAGSPTAMMSLPALTFTVNSTDDNSGGDCVTPNTVCTLRRAIFLANTNIGGTTLITFNISGAGVHTIHPTSNFPDISKQTTIDGTTQPGFAGTPLIEIEGDLMAGGAHEGLKIRASNSVVRGLAINHFTSVFDDENVQVGGSAITILSTNFSPNVNNVFIESNFLGTDPTGEIKKGNDANGVHIFDADNNTIGGTTPQARNILSGNGNPTADRVGVGLAITGGNDNFIYGNYIGTNALGNIKVGNSYGVFFTGINNRFGGDAFGEGNVVSGNGGPMSQFGQCQGGGIYMLGLIDLADGSVQTDANVIKGNKIGTTANGVGPLGNCGVGISSPADVNTVIGSIAQNGRNIISDNGWDALYCGYSSQSTYGLSGACNIIGNNIGTDITGMFAMRNDQRNNNCTGFCLISDTVWTTPSDLAFIIVGSPGGTTPGGDCTGMCNLISGNNDPTGFGGGGLYRSGYGFVLAVNNYLGVNRSGTAALPNRQGFNSYHGSFVFGAELSDGNGGSIDGGNIASGNDQSGTSTTAIVGGGTFEIRGNLVGLSADGNSPIGNGVGGTTSCGICARSQGGTSTAVGGTGNLQRNYIAAETSDPYYNGTRGTGISITTATGSLTTVFNNWVGLNRSGNLAPNSGNGIEVSGDGRTRIGGYNPNEMNFVFGNGRAGVVVSQFTHPQTGVSPAKNVTIARNGIGINGGLGIDLVNASLSDPFPSGVTPNDCFDEDDGANGYQNFPVLFPPVFNGNGTVSVPTTLRSTRARQFTIDYYQSPSADPTNYGEGSNYIGSVSVRTDGNGFAGFTFTSPDTIIPSQTTITATATDQFGNTSEFSCAAGVCETGSFQEALEMAGELTCIVPIVVNVDSDESDPNTADGVCDIDLGTMGEQCSLRAAIQESNARNGKDYINFDIPGSSFHEIALTSPLPVVSDRVDIDATTQHGYSTTPVIYIDGNLTPPGSNGFRLTGGKTTIRGFGISRFTNGNGILIESADNTVEKCHIGVSPNGMEPAVSAFMNNGIYIKNSPRNVIGGINERNLIAVSSNANVLIDGINSKNNHIAVNNFDTAIDNQTFFQNLSATGVLVTDSASLNNIGTPDTEVTDLTVFTYMGGEKASVAFRNGAKENKVAHCLIYHSVIGIAIIRSTDNLIGGVRSFNQNLIGDSASAAIYISDNEPPLVAEGEVKTGRSRWVGKPMERTNSPQIAVTQRNRVQGNYIGIGADGADFHNTSGVVVIKSDNNLIGGDHSSLRNIISRNTEDGIYLNGNNNTVSGNYIGVTPNGQTAAGNGDGLIICGSNNQITKNLVSGNISTGIFIDTLVNEPVSTNNTLTDNGVGTDVTVSNAIPNGLVGIGIALGTANHIGTEVQGNTISGNGNDQSSAGVALGETATQNEVLSNYIGTDRLGTSALGNQGFGVVVSGTGNIVGKNLISGNRTGVRVLNAADARIRQNLIGTNKDVTAAIPNAQFGIVVNNSSGTLIGGLDDDLPEAGNIVAGNSLIGIGVQETSTQTTISGNFIGVSDDGVLIPNGSHGISTKNQSGTLIIGNTVGGNLGNGILVEGNPPSPNEIGQPSVKRELGGFSTRISGNLVGIRSIGGIISKVPNALAGIKLSNVTNVLIGDQQPNSSKNVISGNDGPGVVIEGQNSSANQINNSIIGTDNEGTLDLGNGGEGVKIVNSANNLVGDGAGDPGRETTISGNAGNGVSIEGTGSQNNSVLSSVVGIIKVNQIFRRVPNGLNGIAIVNALNNSIGAANSLLGNRVSGNTRSGILVSGGQAIGNTVRFNHIGDTVGTAFGNTIHGVHLTGGAQNNDIGAEDSGNTISGNGGSGVFIDEPESPRQRTSGTQSTQSNRVTGNNIFNNVGLGIDIFPTGSNPNDDGDDDGGPNRGQNYPQINLWDIVNGDLLINYRVDSLAANSNYGTNGIYVEFFESELSGEGERFIGTNYWTLADLSNGGKVINLGNAAALGISQGDLITASATDADGNTSEFFPPFSPTAAGVSVSGRISEANDNPILNARLTLTDTSGHVKHALSNAFGFYRFEDVEVGQTYVLTVSHKRYTFRNPTRVISVVDELTDVDFTSDP